MKEHYKNKISEDEWLIEENGFERNQQGVRESLFTLGNGYMGSRGALEENPYDSYAGTYMAGVFDNTGAAVSELVNTPNPFFFRITCGEEKLDPVAMDVLEHRRALDMRKGILFRGAVYSNHKKERFSYQSMRFLSMHNKHLGVIQVRFTALDAPAEITVHSDMDSSVTNMGMLTEGTKRHFQAVELSRAKNMRYTCFQTFEKNIMLSYAGRGFIERRGKRKPIGWNILKFKVRKNETLCFTKYFTIYTSYDVNPKRLKSVTLNALKKASILGLEKLTDNHTKAWREKWRRSDISIPNAPEIEKALRFNIYHMLICGNKDGGRTCIGARTLSAEGYRGHVFWDFELFNLPFYIYTDPELAKHLLLYRYNRLDRARENAASRGYRGALFPWESADTGEEETPLWSKGLDGSINKIYTWEMEYHISADVAYGFNHYYTATGDKDFMLKYGLEILFESARFWASVVRYNSKKRRYEIKRVIGPDEFHEEVDNNAYTNIIAKWNLLKAIELYKRFCRDNPKAVSRLAKKIKLKSSELKDWKNIAAKLITHIYDKKNIIEAFDGYFKLKDTPITQLNANLMPEFPKGVTGGNVRETQLVKQADVVMLLYLFPDMFSEEIKKESYSYYAKRTMHKSSLSPSIHAIVGNYIGDPRAYHYFLVTLYADLKNTHGNTIEGMHAASLGGTWQAVVNGFGGVNIKQDILSINPKLPTGWERMSFCIKWKGVTVSVSAFQDKVEISYKSKRNKDSLPMRIYDALKEVSANKRQAFEKRRRA
ncbi:MAG: glycoside hydrolase family 65 protein [Deltaproteobacteria bacterium]|nr:glycoside hydrolase family 65 protein [Deltaproteobacteria bacterium]